MAATQTTMNRIHLLFQAFVAPAIFVSAEGLLLLSLNVRLMGIVSRLRAYLREKHLAMRHGRMTEVETYASQIASIENRAEMIRRAFVLTLYCLIGTIAACLLLGAGLYWQWAEDAAAIVFVASILSLLGGRSTTREKFKWPSAPCGRKRRIRVSWTFTTVLMPPKKRNCHTGCNGKWQPRSFLRIGVNLPRMFPWMFPCRISPRSRREFSAALRARPLLPRPSVRKSCRNRPKENLSLAAR